jgi:hypothetical protein
LIAMTLSAVPFTVFPLVCELASRFQQFEPLHVAADIG